MNYFNDLYRVILVAALVLASWSGVGPGAGVAWAAHTRFFSELNDIPVMPGLYELSDETVVFDKPEGRIVAASAVAEALQAAEIIDFYLDVLPRLGWVRQHGGAGAASFTRQGEKLVLGLELRAGLTIIHFSLSPNP